MLRVKTNSYLTDDSGEDKKAKVTKKCLKKKTKFEDCKNCFEATQLENKMKYLEKNKIDKESLEKDHKGFLKNTKLILRTQQRFKTERYNVFTEEINKIALSSNDDKRMQYN